MGPCGQLDGRQLSKTSDGKNGSIISFTEKKIRCCKEREMTMGLVLNIPCLKNSHNYLDGDARVYGEMCLELRQVERSTSPGTARTVWCYLSILIYLTTYLPFCLMFQHPTEFLSHCKIITRCQHCEKQNTTTTITRSQKKTLRLYEDLFSSA